MTTSFSSLPIIDLHPLSSSSPTPSDLLTLSKDLHNAFATTGFAYLINLTGLDLVWCFLLVFLAFTLLAGLLGFIGYRKVRQVQGPQRAIHQAQEAKEALLNRR